MESKFKEEDLVMRIQVSYDRGIIMSMEEGHKFLDLARNNQILLGGFNEIKEDGDLHALGWSITVVEYSVILGEETEKLLTN